MKKIIFRIIIVAICVAAPVFLYVQTPNLQSQNRELGETTVILVNEDEGITVKDEQYNFGQILAESFMEKSEFDVKSTNFADAFHSLENGNAMYVVVFDREFSKAVDSYDSASQVNGKVRYYYNHSYDTSLKGNVQSENERNRVFEELQNEISSVYSKTIVSKVEETKKMLREDINGDIKLSEKIKDTSEQNTDRLTSELDSANKHISDFKNEMGEKIAVVNENIRSSKETEKNIVQKATENESLISSSKDFYDIFRGNIENSYSIGRNDYLASNNLLTGQNGANPYITNTVIPTYAKYDAQYKNNISRLLGISDIDSKGFINIGLSSYDESHYTQLKDYLRNLKISTLDVGTKEIRERALFTDDEINDLVTSTYNEASGIYGENATLYNAGDYSSLNEMYKTNKSILYNEIKEESIKDGINVATFQNVNVIGSGDPADGIPGGMIRLSEDQIHDFNAYNIFMAILEERVNPALITYDSSNVYYMSDSNNNNFNALKNIVRSEYEPYGGSYRNVREITNDESLGSVNSFYGMDTLNVTDGKLLIYLKSEYEDVAKEVKLLNDYASSLFFHTLEEKITSTFSSQFFSVSSQSMVEFNNDVLLFVRASTETSDSLLREYEEKYEKNLTKLTEDSTLIFNQYEKSLVIVANIIEAGNINLAGYEVMSDNNNLVKEENTQIIEHVAGIRDNNTKINETASKNAEDYLASLKGLSDANIAQDKFVKEYEKVLEVANVEGVSNVSFFDFITSPIEFSKEDIGTNISTMTSYFIVFWLFAGLLIINGFYDRFKKYFTLHLSRGDFKDNKAIMFLNKHIIYASSLGLFGLVYSIVLINKYNIPNTFIFIGEMILIVTLISFIMRKLINRSRFMGYGIILFVIAIMYTLLFASGESALSQIIAMPMIVIDNFILVNIYELSYANAFLYTISIYAGIALFVSLMDIAISKKQKNREV